jgi:predicted nucleotide-binding protein
MKKLFEGSEGRERLVRTLLDQKIVNGQVELAAFLADKIKLIDVPAGKVLIEQRDESHEVYFIIAGQFSILVNGKHIANRFAGEHVGEIAAIRPNQRRSATVVAQESSVIGSMGDSDFIQLADRYPSVWRTIAAELAKRLEQRNRLIAAKREKVRALVISSSEALPVARAIQNAFKKDPFITVVWDQGVFKATNYALEDLEQQLDRMDFAIAIAHADDLTEFRGKKWPTPRDNVVLELGLFMGRLGRSRAILMEPQGEEVKLPSDYAGIKTVRYKFEKGDDLFALLGPACNEVRDHILELGPLT